MLENEWTLEIVCEMKEGNHKRPHSVWFNLNEISRRDKSIDTEKWISGCLEYMSLLGVWGGKVTANE